MVVIFGSEQLTSGKVKESTKTMGKNTNGGIQMVVVGLAQEGHTTNVLQSSQARHYPVSDTQRLRSETRDDMTGRWDKSHQKGVILER